MRGTRELCPCSIAPRVRSELGAAEGGAMAETAYIVLAVYALIAVLVIVVVLRAGDGPGRGGER